MEPIAAAGGGSAALHERLVRLHGEIARRGVHPSRCVVVVPYAQLMASARQAWSRIAPDGFAPRFETTMNWAASCGFVPGVADLSFDQGLDLLTARDWLDGAGLGPRAGVLAPRLVEAAWQLAGPAAAAPPAKRADWAERARAEAGMALDHPVLGLEAAIARIAVEWAALSGYASDALLTSHPEDQFDLLLVLQGLQPEPVTQALIAWAGERALCWPLDEPAAPGALSLYRAADPAHEAEMAAACVMRHLEAGRAPVALAATDRVLTRRVRAMLGARGVAIADETGWKLSTTRAAAQAMALLRAASRQASSDEVLDWLKNTPAAAPRTVTALERRVRRAGLRQWSAVNVGRLGGEPAAWGELLDAANAWRECLQAGRPLAQWQRGLREALEATGLWSPLAADPAGAQLAQVLGLDDVALARWATLPQSARRMSLADFTSWADASLEAATFKPERAAAAQVVILPFSQLLGRAYAALVVPGCDEVRLAPSPQPAGPWSPAQREALGLPSREALEAALRAGFRSALQAPRVDLLVRRTDDSGEPVLPSPLVQALLLDGLVHEGDEPRAPRTVEAQPVPRPMPSAAQLPVTQLSASAYDDLRHCPYRFFSLRQLGLQEAEEIDTDLDKRDFGTWLHEILRHFHEALRDGQQDTPEHRRALMEQAQQQVTRAQQLPEGEFLPFAASWPLLRDGYLQALAQFQDKQGARFEVAETDHELQLGPVRLRGRIDRIDRLPGGLRMVMDYKTENLKKTETRIKQPMEDTQLAFYAALLHDDELRAAYVNVGERGETRFKEQPQVLQAREALVHGILDDLRRIGEGAALPALGEGAVCDYCAARGLCRKDSWTA